MIFGRSRRLQPAFAGFRPGKILRLEKKKPKAIPARNSPPLFGIYSNHPDLISKTYKKYLINQIRERFNFEGVPINISFRKK